MIVTRSSIHEDKLWGMGIVPPTKRLFGGTVPSFICIIAIDPFCRHYGS